MYMDILNFDEFTYDELCGAFDVVEYGSGPAYRVRHDFGR